MVPYHFQKKKKNFKNENRATVFTFLTHLVICDIICDIAKETFRTPTTVIW